MADVFTNDLRIREQETGANANLWGGYLNTSLENIAEAFSYGTEALADSAAQTLTLADGASDELRSFYVKLTGTLSQATTVTLAPNTISKVWMIENATTGGYDVTISQGSGANVVVGNGNVKMIATDGAGSGGVVYDLFTDLELAGNVSITTTDNTSNLSLISTDADANIGPVLELYRNSASPADNDELGRIYFYGENDNDEKIEYVLFKSNIVDASDGAEGSSLQIFTYSTGGQRNRIDLLEGETVFNDGSADLDFRVESDGNANMLVVDAGTDRVGVGTSPDYRMHIFTSDSSASAHGNADDLFIENSGNAGMTIGSGTTSNGSIFFSDSDSTLSGQIEYRHSDDSLYIITGGSNRLHIQADGDLDIIDGNLVVASGHGIDFSATANEGNVYSELFDDYEEGHIEPTVTGSASGTYTLSSTSNSYAYTKIGQRVFISGYLNITGGSGTGQLRVSMPFTAATMTDDQGYSFGSGLVQNNGSTITGQKYAFVSDAATYFDFYHVNDAGSAQGLPCSSLDTVFQIGFDFSFIAA